ncbi:MAG: hypothetical protein GXO83_05195 [Chlorobi bacterium]|nr:hypothetical protein [Chlorobiota bacterium]
MGMKNIEKRSFFYGLLKSVVMFWHNKVYYRRIIVLNAGNVPKNELVIFAPNHQNALMDAMAVLGTQPGQPVFLARSDIFKKKFIADILTFLKILPVYRIRDGYASLKNNDQIFRKTIDVIENKNGLVVLPEGNHAPYRRLRILKKGIARLAFQAAEKNNFSKDIKIVPVGIDYSDYYKFRQKLTVNYGEPISLSDYYDLYRENPNKAIITLMRDLSERMKKQMIHIDDPDHYETIDHLRTLFAERIANRLQKNLKPLQRFRSQQEFVTLLNEFIHRDKDTLDNLEQEVQAYTNEIQKFGLRSWVLNKQKMTIAGFLWRIMVLIVFFPVFLYGLINNWMPYKLPVVLASKVKDKAFTSSLKFVLSFIFFPLFHLIQTLLAGILTDSLQIALIYLVSLPLSGIFAFQYYIAFKKFRARWRYSWLARKQNPEIQRLEKLHHILQDFIYRVSKKEKII